MYYVTPGMDLCGTGLHLSKGELWIRMRFAGANPILTGNDLSAEWRDVHLTGISPV